MKSIMVLGAGQFQAPLIQFCKKQGHRVIAVDYNPKAEGFRFSDIALPISTIDKEKILEAARTHRIDAIVTTSDYPVRTVAYVCEQLNLVGLSSYAAKACTDKSLLREIMKREGIYTPKFWCISDLQQLTCLEKIAFPVVIKPVDSSASRGVRLVTKFGDLAKIYNDTIVYSKSKKVIIEEYIDGPEYSIEVLVQHGNVHIIAITEKTTSELPYFIEERHIVPANLSIQDSQRISSLVNNIIQVVKLDNSAAHVEVRLTSSGPVLIEMGARLGGDYITSDLVPLATGVNMLANIVEIALGEPVQVQASFNKFAGIQFVAPEDLGRVTDKTDILLTERSLIKYKLDLTAKNVYQSSLDRCGYFIVCDEERKSIVAFLDQVKKYE